MNNGSIANTEHKADYFAARSNNVHYNVNTGLVYQGWGGFSYNGSKYKGETIRESEFNSSLSGFNMNLQIQHYPVPEIPIHRLTRIAYSITSVR